MHYVIVGNGVAGITAAFTLREGDPAASITVISGESDYFFSRTALMYAFMDRMNLRDLEPYERKVYREQRIGLRRAEVVSLDAAANALVLRGGERIGYDRLLLCTGSKPRRPEWQGLADAREGVVNFVSLQDLEACERLAATARRAVVVGGGLIGVELVECLRHFGIEVTFLVREPHYWPAALYEPEGRMVSEHIRRHGVRVEHGQAVASVASEQGRVRAVRCESGEEFPCDLLGIAIGVEPNVQWLRGGPQIGKGILVDRAFRTSLPRVWAAGDCAEPGEVEQIWYAAKRQGALAAQSMLGGAVDYHPPLFFNSAKFFDIEYTTVGQVSRLPADAVNWYRRLEGKDVSVRIVAGAGGAVIGFNMLGSRWNHEVLERWIHERRSLEDVVARLPEAQFDVEFGRAPLEAMR